MQKNNAKDIIARFSPVAVKYDSIFNVLIRDQFSGLEFWCDVWTQNGDLLFDWNQYIFYDIDEEDMLRKEIQESSEVAGEAMCCAFDYLRNERCIYNDKAGNSYMELVYSRYDKIIERTTIIRIPALECLKKDGHPKETVKKGGLTYKLYEV